MDAQTTEIYTLSLHDALPISQVEAMLTSLTDGKALPAAVVEQIVAKTDGVPLFVEELVKMILESGLVRDRKSTRLNSSHGSISYAVFCLKKKKIKELRIDTAI